MKPTDAQNVQKFKAKRLSAWLHFHPISPKGSSKFHLILSQTPVRSAKNVIIQNTYGMKEQSKSSCGTKKKVARSRKEQGERPGRAECRLKGKVHFRNERGGGGRAVPHTITLISFPFCCDK